MFVTLLRFWFMPLWAVSIITCLVPVVQMRSYLDGMARWSRDLTGRSLDFQLPVYTF
jgi:hypothetical protein